MKATLPTRHFIKGLELLSGIGISDEIPLHIRLDKDGISMSAYDGRVVSTVSSGGDVLDTEGADEITIPAAALAGAARDIPGDVLEIEVTHMGLYLTSGTLYKATFNPMPYDGRKPWASRDPGAAIGGLRLGSFAKAVRRALIAVSRDESEVRYSAINGVHIKAERDGDIVVEATDLFHLVRQVYSDEMHNLELDVVIPAKAAAELVRMGFGSGLHAKSSEASDEKVVVFQHESGQLSFQRLMAMVDGWNHTIQTELIPGWGVIADKLEAAIPHDLPSSMVVPGARLAEAIGVAMLAAPENLKGADREIQLSMEGGDLVVTGRSSRKMTAVAVPGAAWEGSILEPISVYGRRLQGLIRALPDLNIRMHFAGDRKEAQRGILFKVADTSKDPMSDRFFCVMMRVRDNAIEQKQVAPMAFDLSIPF